MDDYWGKKSVFFGDIILTGYPYSRRWSHSLNMQAVLNGLRGHRERERGRQEGEWQKKRGEKVRDTESETWIWEGKAMLGIGSDWRKLGAIGVNKTHHIDVLILNKVFNK